MIQGRRVDWEEGSADSPFPLLHPGDYGKDQQGAWVCITPNGLYGNLSNHSVIENDDGTITVSPSVLIKTRGRSSEKEYHGFIEKGIWREC
jgi:hypothetical protein